MKGIIFGEVGEIDTVRMKRRPSRRDGGRRRAHAPEHDSSEGEVHDEEQLCENVDSGEGMQLTLDSCWFSDDSNDYERMVEDCLSGHLHCCRKSNARYTFNVHVRGPTSYHSQRTPLVGSVDQVS